MPVPDPKLPDPIKIPGRSPNPPTNKNQLPPPPPSGSANALPNTSDPPSPSTSSPADTHTGTSIPPAPHRVRDNEITTKELLIALGAVLAAVIIFFIVKNYLSRMLVANFRKSPRSADMAAWFLFLILLFATIAAVIGILDSTRLLSLPYLVPLGVVILVSIIMFVVALSSKR